MDKLQIRPLDSGHLDGVAALERACFAAPWSREALGGELDHARALLPGAFVGGELVGYACLHHLLDEGELHRIGVLPDARGLGVGGALLAWLVKEARALGLTTMFLEVRAANEAALALYHRHGFQRSGLRRGYYQNPAEDAVLMTLML